MKSYETVMEESHMHFGGILEDITTCFNIACHSFFIFFLAAGCIHDGGSPPAVFIMQHIPQDDGTCFEEVAQEVASRHMDAKKRKRRLTALAGSGLSVRQLAKVIEHLEGGEAACASNSTILRDVHAAVDIDTPFGKLIQKGELPLANGGTHSFTYCDPAALMFHLCSTCARFAALVENCTADGPAGLVLYTDETTPGNQMRPDSSREVMCLYYTLLQLPVWFRARNFGWMVFCCIKTNVMDKILGGLSQLVIFWLTIFFAGEVKAYSFTVGVRLPRGLRSGSVFLLRLVLICFVQDEKAHKLTFSLKGAGGYKFCCNCKNVLRCELDRMPPGAYFHLSQAKPEDFDLHTADTFLDVVEKLNNNLHADNFEELEIVLGLTYNLHTVLWHPWARQICNPVDHVYWDGMHVIVGSGGVAQFEMNSFIRECGRHTLHGEPIRPEVHMQGTCQNSEFLFLNVFCFP